MSADDLEKPMTVPLVRALTREPTVRGVPQNYFWVECIITSVLFLATHNLLMLFSIIPLHLFGYVMTLRDDRIFPILFVRLSRCPPRSRAFWGCDSYKV